MAAADKWQKYQENYTNQEIDPAPEVYKNSKPKSKSVKATPKEKITILMFIIVVGICCIVTIFFQACASKINYTVYTLNQEINSLSGDIDNLTAEINGYNKLEDLEYRAINDLLMVYPDNEQYVYVEDLTGSREVEDYIAALAESQKGITIKKNATVAEAAKRLLKAQS